MKRLLYFLLLSLAPLLSKAQSWKTVTTNSITYFYGGNYQGFQGSLDSNELRMIMIDSFSVANGDSTFYFFPNIRDIRDGDCMDTLGASWQGAKIIHKADGTEYFFNSFNDTITIKTQAMPGDSWPLASDTSGVIFQATVSQAGLTNVDGMPDSFKTITIQAIKNGTQIADDYNNLVFKLSKDHGWLQALDMYRFPNKTATSVNYGTTTYPGPSFRLNNNFANLDLNHIDLVKKYIPGNEWIHYKEQGAIHQNGEWIYYDSVISATPISTNSISVQFKSEECDIAYDMNGSQSSISAGTRYHTDTIVNNDTARIINKNIYPELNDVKNISHNNFFTHYFIDTLCNDKYIFTSDLLELELLMFDNGCWRVMPSVSSYSYYHTSILSGFGPIFNRSEMGEGPAPYFYTKEYYTYVKLGDCITGKKTNILSLNVDEIQNSNTLFTVYPNPAKDKVFVQSVAGDQKGDVMLCDMIGKVILQQEMTTGTTTINIADIVPGIYLLSVKSKNANHTFKLQIQ